MPQAFMFTRKPDDEEPKIDNITEMKSKDMIQEQSNSISEASVSGIEDLTNDTDSSSECPDELYNLTKLANVSVAAAAGKIFDRRPLNEEESFDEEEFMYTHKLFDKSTKAFRGHLIKRTKRPSLQSANDLSTLSSISKSNIPSSTQIIHSSIDHNIQQTIQRPTSQTNTITMNYLNEESSNSNTCNIQEEIDDESNTQTGLNQSFPPSSNTINKRSNTNSSPSPNSTNSESTENSKQFLELDEHTHESIDQTSISETIPNESHSCRDCGKCYSTSSNLARHRQTHRSPGDKKARRCPHCDKLYVSMPAYAMHVRTHNQGCRCQFCGKCFSRPWLLQGHIRTHTGEKPFKCNICNKAFADKSNLRAHVQTHSNTKPHVCKRCGKAFALKSYLYKHEESSCMRYNNNNNNISIKSEDHQELILNSHSPSSNSLSNLSSSPNPSTVIVQMSNASSNSIGTINNASVIMKNIRTHSATDPSSYSPSIASEGHNNPIRSFLSPAKSPNMYFRSTVISPNPERILYTTIEHPSVMLTAPTRFYTGSKYHQEQPMDFSKGVKMAIAV